MKDFKFYDRLAGWAAFAVALVCYLLTVEPTASWWDCGEFIATAVKLEVGHPPGAPLWMIIGRVAALLASDDAHMALMMNCTAVLAAAFTSLLLFWSVTHLARRVVERMHYKGERVSSYNPGQTIAILGSGMLGALIYTFCDTAWFSAVEAEVYSMSSLFTAVVFWLILKWEEHAGEAHSTRWLVLICYLMGLSIGVHLLNLLVIPAIVLVFYFRKWKNATVSGALLAFLVSVVILAVVLYVIIPQTVNIGAYYDLFFVNVLGMPYYSGIITFLILLMGGLGFLAWLFQKYNKVVLNTVSLGLFMIMLGYTSFAMTVIRSFSNTPINENQPSDGFSLLSYLNREQYGDTPLLYGAYFTADVVDQKKEYTYIPVDGKYLEIQKPSPKYVYSPGDMGWFPRMHSSQSHHVEAYKQWAGLDNLTKRPTFGQNMRFFFSYQMGHMYWRYFMWNFCGRQSDEQNGAGSYIKGNWITGIDFIDNLRGAGSEFLPDRYAGNHGRNVYYMLPLLLGLLGLLFHLMNDSRNSVVVGLFFLLTGVAIVVYLNQTPLQPRERDYAFAGSFYAFSIWCGLGLLALWDLIRNMFGPGKEHYPAIIACLALLVPVQMACQNWDDHDRSGRYTCPDFARNYLESCAENAILFTFGDNDTFPLWYVQEVEGVRRDIRIVNLSLAGCDWYVKQAQERKYEGAPVPMTLDYTKYRQDKRNIVICTDQADRFVSDKYESQKDKLGPVYEGIYNDFIALIDKTDFPVKYASDYKQIIGGYNKVNITLFARLITLFGTNAKLREQIFGANTEPIMSIVERSNALMDDISKVYTPISAIMAVAGNDDDLVQMGNGENYNYIPSKKVSIPVNKQNCLDNGTIDESTMSRVGQELKWDISKNYFTKSDLVIMDILSANDWKRPVYFAASGSPGDYMGLDKFFRLEGFCYRVVPYITKSETPGEMGEVDTKFMYDNMMNKFRWGRMNEPDVILEENNLRQIKIMDVRGTFARLANTLVDQHKTDEAQAVLQKCLELTPNKKVPYDYTMLPVLSSLYEACMTEQADQVASEMIEDYTQICEWLSNLCSDGFVESREFQMSVSILAYIAQQAQEHGSSEILSKVETIYQKYAVLVQQYVGK